MSGASAPPPWVTAGACRPGAPAGPVDRSSWRGAPSTPGTPFHAPPQDGDRPRPTPTHLRPDRARRPSHRKPVPPLQAIQDDDGADLVELLCQTFTACGTDPDGPVHQVDAVPPEAVSPEAAPDTVAELLVAHPTLIRAEAPRMAERLVEDIFTAFDEQTVIVARTGAATTIVPSLAGQLRPHLSQRGTRERQIAALPEAHPLSELLTSMPGIGVRTGTRILIDIGDTSTFATAGHLAAYAGLAPASRISGSCVRGEQPSRRGKNSSNGPSPSPARPPAPTTTANAPRAKRTRKPSSASPDAASTSCSPCSATAPSTNQDPQRLPERIADHQLLTLVARTRRADKVSQWNRESA